MSARGGVLDGKAAIVTGASSGIGFAIAEAMSAEGAKVVLVGRDEERLKRCAERCAEHLVAVVDLTSDRAPDLIVEMTMERFGTIDLIVHSAGIFGRSRSRRARSRTSTAMAGQRAAPYALTQAALPHLGPTAGHLRLVDRGPGRLPKLGRVLRDEGRHRTDDAGARRRAGTAGHPGQRASRPGTSDGDERDLLGSPDYEADESTHPVRPRRRRRGHRPLAVFLASDAADTSTARALAGRRRLGGAMTIGPEERCPRGTRVRVRTPAAGRAALVGVFVSDYDRDIDVVARCGPPIKGGDMKASSGPRGCDGRDHCHGGGRKLRVRRRGRRDRS